MSTAAIDPFAVLAQRYADRAAAINRTDPFGSPGALAQHVTQGREMQAPHLELIDDAYTRIADGRLDKRGVIITMPPRHGKSQRTSRWGPIWYLRRNPDHRVVLAGYGQEFIDTHARWVRDTIDSPPWVDGKPFNFGLAIRPTSKAAARWDLEQHSGGMIAVGVGGPLTGRGADLLIIDDPVKDAAEADSAVIRERTWDWYESVAVTRLEPDAKCIVIMTRWHEDDLVGRLLAREPTEWEHIDLPALAEDDDPLGRAPGDALWPDRYDVDALRQRRAQLSPRWWSALYQQRPAPPEGSVWRDSWITEHRVLLGQVPPDLRTVVAVDPAAEGGEKSAEHGIVAVGGDHRASYVLDDASTRGTPTEACLAVWRLAVDVDAVAVVIEDNQGKAWLETVLRSTWPEVAQQYLKAGRRVIPPDIVRVNARVGKRLRAEPVAAFYQQGLVHHLADGSDRLAVLEGQMVGWTGEGPSPDRLDALVHGLTYLFEPGREKDSRQQVIAASRWGRASGRR